MIGSFSAGCGRRNSARRALPGESVGRKGEWGPLGFLRAAARTCWVCPAGRVRWTEGGWIPYREAPTPKAFPSGGRCPSARTGADEGAIDSPNGTGEGGRKGDRSLLLQGKVGYRIAPSSVTFGDSFPPRGSLWVVQPYPKKRPKSGHVHGHRNSPTIAPLRPTTPKPASGNERAIKPGVQGACPRPSFSPFLGRNGDPAGQAGPPGRCDPRHRKSPDRPKGT